MFNRLTQFPQNNSFFLFGARGTGKTFLLKERFKKKSVLYIDLLDPEQDEIYTLRPQTLTEQIAASGKKMEWVIIDEIQKIPKSSTKSTAYSRMARRTTGFLICVPGMV